MQYEEFVRTVKGRIEPTDPGEAEKAVMATLETLGECIRDDEATDLADQLPKELKEPLLRQPPVAKPYSLEQFFQRVGERENIDATTAAAHATAVMEVLNEAVSKGELRDVLSQLSPQFSALIDARGQG